MASHHRNFLPFKKPNPRQLTARGTQLKNHHTLAHGMPDDPQENPSPSAWLDDFKAILALSPSTSERTKAYIFDKYPDAGWANEYQFSLWNASCYLKKYSEELDDAGLVVLGQGALVKDAVLLALYHEFLSCPLETMHKLNIPIADVIARANDLLKDAESNTSSETD